MFKSEANRHINAGENEFYRYGKKAQEMVAACLEPRNGFYSIQADGGKYWTFGTSEGKFGEFAKWEDTFFSVNRGGFLYAKEGTEKGEKFCEMLNQMLEDMKKAKKDQERACNHWDGEEEEVDE